MRLKKIFTPLLIMFIAMPHVAQSKSLAERIEMIYGVSAGVVLPAVKFEGNDADVSTGAGFKLGMMWGVDLGKVEILPELWYSTFKMNFDSDSSGQKGATLKNKSLDFPVMVGVDLSRNVKLHFGPTLSLMCNNELTHEDGDLYEFGRIKGSVRYAAAISYNIMGNFSINTRYTGGFSPKKNDYFDGDEPYNIKVSTFDITAALRF